MSPSVETTDPVDRKCGLLAGIVLALSVLVARPGAQEGKAEPSKPATVAVLGASVSAGFVDFVTAGPGVERNRTISVAAACRAIWPRERAKVRDYSDTSMFLGPAKEG